MKVGFHGCYEQHQHQIAGRTVLKLKRGATVEAKQNQKNKNSIPR
jgi:hypothetical protein